MVWYYFPINSRGKTPKFCAKWTGPYVIVEAISDVLYRIQFSEDKPSKVVHHNHLKPCKLRGSANVDRVDELYGDVSSCPKGQMRVN